jgi:hypothetical protein
MITKKVADRMKADTENLKSWSTLIAKDTLLFIFNEGSKIFTDVP